MKNITDEAVKAETNGFKKLRELEYYKDNIQTDKQSGKKRNMERQEMKENCDEILSATGNGYSR